METLNYEVLKKIGYTGFIQETAPEKVLQFGEGNFLRAFADYFFDLANEKVNWNGKCALVQPIPNEVITEKFKAQQGLYTVYLRGSEEGKKINQRRVISSVSRCLNPYEKTGLSEIYRIAESDDLEIVVSNTTEAGIAYDPSCKLEDEPASSFPGKLTQVLYRRYKAGKNGLIILSCELIDNNGRELLKCVNQYVDLWNLEEGFRSYVKEECTFCSTLVDRIVPGAIRNPEEAAKMEQENGYADGLADVGECFGVWVIEGPEWLTEKLPFKKAGLNCIVVPDVTPYKKRKVRILNGAHTGFVLGAYLAGFNIVRDCMQDDVVLKYMNQMLQEEVIPTLPLDKEDCRQFAKAVQDRFNNPFVDHQLLSISLNSTSKWLARNFPSLLEYTEEFGKLPACLTMSFAAYIAFYTSDIQALTEEGLVCRRPQGDCYCCKDDRWILEFYEKYGREEPEKLVHLIMTNISMWGQDLTIIPGFEKATVENLKLIREKGAKAAFATCIEKEN